MLVVARAVGTKYKKLEMTMTDARHFPLRGVVGEDACLAARRAQQRKLNELASEVV